MTVMGARHDCFDSGGLTEIGPLALPFIQPALPWEKTGQYAAGTTFIEGLVLFRGKWFLCYGCADSFVGVAICDPATNRDDKK